jgi:flavodoxin
MRTCILYLSRTGNTRRLAEAISDLLNAPVFDIAKSEPSIIKDFDLLILGTPVTGFQPAPEVLSFVKRLPEGEGKKTILFCTYAVAKGSTVKILEKELAKKGYSTILSASKKGVKPSKADFAEVLDEIARTVEAQPR